jgi:DNA-binding NtrC family response regulator
MSKILIVDDNPEVLKLIENILESNDYKVKTALSGKSAIKELESNEYDMVLTDLMMPDVDGMQVLEHAKLKTPRTMCIILTGHGTIKSSVEAIKKGAFDYITKPVSPSELLIIVEKALKFKSLEEENILWQKY